jgi:hypothetical protein
MAYPGMQIYFIIQIIYDMSKLKVSGCVLRGSEFWDPLATGFLLLATGL